MFWRKTGALGAEVTVSWAGTKKRPAQQIAAQRHYENKELTCGILSGKVARLVAVSALGAISDLGWRNQALDSDR
jgi:hypothetical protein